MRQSAFTNAIYVAPTILLRFGSVSWLRNERMMDDYRGQVELLSKNARKKIRLFSDMRDDPTLCIRDDSGELRDQCCQIAYPVTARVQENDSD